MTSLIYLYESFNEALHAVQELEAANIPPGEISLVSLDGKLSPHEHDAQDKGHSKRGTDRPLDSDLRAKFFAQMHVHQLAGLDPVLAGGWIVAATMERTPATDLAPNGQGLSTAQAIGLLTCLTDHGLTKEIADTYLEGLKRGATLLGVHVTDGQQKTAQQILSGDHCPVDPRMRGRHYAAKQAGPKDMTKVNADRSSSMLIGGLGKR
jgi:hypothetical protein